MSTTEPPDDQPSAVKAERLLEAREYFGFSQDDVAGAMKREQGWVDDIEHGRQRVTGEELRKLSRLYQRPVAWLRGETTFHPGPELLRKVEHLDEGDREAMLDFAEFLEGAERPPAPRAFTHFPPQSGMDDQAAEDNGIIG